MRYSISALALAFAALLPQVSLAAPKSITPRTAVRATNPHATLLTPDAIANIYVSPARATLARFKTTSTLRFAPTEALSINLVQDPQTQESILFITALVDSGTYRLILTCEGRDYACLVHVGEMDESGRPLVEYTRTFRFGQTSQETVTQGLERLAAAPRLDPHAIDLKAILPRIERAKRDPVYRSQLSDYEEFRVDKPYSWNDTYVWLKSVHEFYDSDLLLIEIEWRNTTQDAIFLDCDQILCRVAGQDMPVRMSTQRSLGTVLPGQIDTIYLIMQGDRVAPQNDFELVLPPDARMIREKMGQVSSNR